MKKTIVLVITLMLLGVAENAAALFQVSPSTLTFGKVDPGLGVTLPVTVNNKASTSYPNIDVTISSMGITSGADAFKISGENCPDTLSVGSSCTVSVRFSPPYGETAAYRTGNLRITTAEEGALNVWLYGEVNAEGKISFSRTSIDFGNVIVDHTSSKNIQVTNGTGLSVNLTVSSSYIFQTSHNCGTLAAGGSCSIDVTFAPTETGHQTRTIGINWSDGSEAIFVSGTGVIEDDGTDGSDGCFIATASYGTYFDPYLKIVRVLKLGTLPALALFILAAALFLVLIRRGLFKAQ